MCVCLLSALAYRLTRGVRLPGGAHPLSPIGNARATAMTDGDLLHRRECARASSVDGAFGGCAHIVRPLARREGTATDGPGRRHRAERWRAAGPGRRFQGRAL